MGLYYGDEVYGIKIICKNDEIIVDDDDIDAYAGYEQTYMLESTSEITNEDK
jgi:hypothetical protein